MSDEIEQGTSRHVGLWPFGIACAFVIVVWVLNLVILSGVEERGVYGDMFGAANSVFSGFAFAGVVYAIFLQRHEVALAKTELDRTKKLLERQQDLAAQQELASQRTIFEGTFFQMLRLFSDLVSQMDLRLSTESTANGKDVFTVFKNKILKKKSRSPGNLSTLDAYAEFYQQYSHELGHYFRTLYNIFKLIDQSTIENKRMYSNLVRAQLSDDEANLLAMNGLSPQGAKFRPLIEKYSLLKNASRDQKMIAECLKEYKNGAF